MRCLAPGLHALVFLCVAASAGAQPAPEAPPEPAEEGDPADDPGLAQSGDESPDDADEPPQDAGQPAGEELPEGHPPVKEGVKEGEALPPGHPPLEGEAAVGDPVEGAAEGEAESLPPIPLAPPALFPSQLAEEEEEELVGFQGGLLFIRDPHDTFRLYPGGHVSTDFLWSPGAPDLPAIEGARHLGPTFMVRRANLELRGEIIERIAFTAGIALGSQRIGETEYIGPDTTRFAPASAHDGVVRPSEANISYRFRDWLGLTAGLQNVPFSMSNRNRHFLVPFTERSIAIRGFAVPYEQDLGMTIWGDLFEERMLSYEFGVFGGDGPARPFADARADFMGRVWARPLDALGDGPVFDNAQIGISARWGERDPSYVAYDYPTMASNHGFVFWQPGYVDSFERVTHVIPSGSQRAIGGEIRLPFDVLNGVFELRGEGYYVNNRTREGVAGFRESHTERFGRVEGGSWYVQATYWACCTHQLVTGEPGVYRPWSMEPGRDIPVKRGLELSALASSIIANYSGATRQGSTADPNTPDSNIALYQFGGIAQYWFNYNFRAAAEYFAYYAPDSGDPSRNQAVVPDNLVITDGARGGGNVHHELGARLAVTF